MIYAHVSMFMTIAEAEIRNFIDNHNDEIERIKKSGYFIVVMKNGDEHHFLSDAIYGRWCMGRTYMRGDTLYHSGFPFKNDWKS